LIEPWNYPGMLYLNGILTMLEINIWDKDVRTVSLFCQLHGCWEVYFSQLAYWKDLATLSIPCVCGPFVALITNWCVSRVAIAVSFHI